MEKDSGWGEKWEKTWRVNCYKADKRPIANGDKNKNDERDNYVTKCTVDERRERRLLQNDQERLTKGRKGRVLVDIRSLERIYEHKPNKDRILQPLRPHSLTPSPLSPFEVSGT